MIAIPKQYTSLIHIKSLSWEEVFSAWRELEVWQDSWKQHWTERGFDSWDEWRGAYVDPLHPETLSWELYHIGNPIKDLPFFSGVPTQGWAEKAYNGETTKQLKDISHLPLVTEHQKILALRQNFPKETMLIGIVHKGNIILIEGMHRASALATWNSHTPFIGSVAIALAQWDASIPTLGGDYKIR